MRWDGDKRDQFLTSARELQRITRTDENAFHYLCMLITIESLSRFFYAVLDCIFLPFFFSTWCAPIWYCNGSCVKKMISAPFLYAFCFRFLSLVAEHIHFLWSLVALRSIVCISFPHIPFDWNSSALIRRLYYSAATTSIFHLLPSYTMTKKRWVGQR